MDLIAVDGAGEPTGAVAAARRAHVGVEQGRILLVDDDPTMRVLLRCALETDGYDLLEAPNGRCALELFAEHRPDVVLMDASMPVMDGFAACAALRRLSGGSQIPVLMITALEDDASMERAFEVGASDYIAKPVNWKALRQRVRAMVRARRTEQRIDYLAYHDCLTGLANRAYFMECLATSIGLACVDRGRVALLFLDLDGFKLINDTLGHEAGDLLLKGVAGRLSTTLRGSDLMARLGGDEFTVLLHDIDGPGRPTRVANRVLEALAPPIRVVDRDIHVGASIGIAVFPDNGRDAVSLLKNADTAMYRAKERGRNTYQFYTPDMGAQVQVRMSLESGIRRALEQREFTVDYQPVVDLASGRLTGHEALVRWHHPELGLVPPADFIPLAEDTGLIDPLGRWVLEEACRQNVAWQSRSPHPLRVAVNVSACQFRDRALVGNIRAILAEVGMAPALLELELTENTVMHNTGQSVAMLSEMKALGIRVSVDDFGTGYSSLSYLKRLPLDALKIDRSFVGNVPTDTGDSAIVRAIVAMAHSLRLAVVAEGVESPRQIEFLRELGCDMAQGYLLGRPQPAAALAGAIASGEVLGPGTASPLAGCG